jgi:predicted transcriptional regulator
MEAKDQPTKLSNLQLEVLKIFSRNISDEQLLEIKAILSAYFAEKATKEMDRLWDERGWTQETMQQWLKEHMRTPYKK